MKIISASYQHNRPGFPGVCLKWHYADGVGYISPYITVLGIIQPWSWEYSQVAVPSGGLEREIARFDTWVGERYCNDASVQG